MAGSRNIADSNSWFVATASVAGTKHIRKSQPNQDALRYRTLPGTDHLVAVGADGAGSAPMGRQGAMVATKMAPEFAWDTLTRQHAQDLTSLLTWSIGAAREKVLQTAEEAELPARDFATTLLAFIQANGHQRPRKSATAPASSPSTEPGHWPPSRSAANTPTRPRSLPRTTPS